MNMRKLLARLVLMGLFLLAVVWGCAQDENLGLPNTPPETYVSIADSVRNPTVYIQELHWWGDDMDGEVVGYEYRWFQDPAEPGCPMDTDWVFTSETSHEFHIPATDAAVRTHRVEVRAVDNRQAVDPTPSSLVIPVTNTPPVLKLQDSKDLPDTTYPAIMVKWEVDDAEGRGTMDYFKAWLDGNEENARIVAGEDSSVSFGYDDFQGRYGQRTLYLFGMDSGCSPSNMVTYTWQVKEPLGNILIVDDLWSRSGAVDYTTNNVYMGLMRACAGTYSKLDLEKFGGVTYAHNYPALFEIYDLVIWYDDPVRAISTTLPFARDAVRDYAAGGGNFLLVSLTALGPQGAFSDETMFEVFGVDSLYWRLDGDGHLNPNFDCKRAWNIRGNTDLGLDSLNVVSNTLGAKCMAKSESAISLYHITPGTVDVIQKVDYYLAVMNYWGNGKVAVFTIPLSKCNGYMTLQNEFCRIFQLMLGS
jgi:hypothetical protein